MSISRLVVVTIFIIGFIACKKERKTTSEIEIEVTGPVTMDVSKEDYPFDTIYKYFATIKCNSDSFFMPVMNDSFKIQPNSTTWLKVIGDSTSLAGGISDFVALKNYKMKIGEKQTFYFINHYTFPNFDTLMFDFSYYRDTSRLNTNSKGFHVVCNLKNDTVKNVAYVKFFDK